MKKRRIAVLIGSILTAALLFASCSNNFKKPTVLCSSSNGAYENGRLYFNIGGMNMRYLNAITQCDEFLCQDPVCDHYNANCFSYIEGFGSLYLAAADGCVYTVVFSMQNQSYEILCLDTINNKRSYAVRDFPDSIGRFIVCDTGTYFCGLDEDGKQNIYFANKSGKYRCLTEDIPSTVVLISIADDKVWFYDFDGNIWMADYDFETMEIVCQIQNGLTKGYFYMDGYLYYFDDPVYEEYTVKDRVINNTSYSLYRISVPESSAPEKICDSVHAASNMIFADGEIWVAASDFTIIDKNYYTSGGKLIKIDADTLEKEEILIKKTDMGGLAYAGDDYICGFGKFEDKDGNIAMGYIVYDRNNGEQYCVRG